MLRLRQTYNDYMTITEEYLCCIQSQRLTGNFLIRCSPVIDFWNIVIGHFTVMCFNVLSVIIPIVVVVVLVVVVYDRDH